MTADTATEERVAEFMVDPQDDRQRLDVVISACTELSRSRAAALIREGHVHVEQRPATRSSERVSAGQRIVINIPPAAPSSAEPQDLPLDIVHEDDDVVVVNKASGVVVHPAPGHWDGTLVNALLHHCGQLSGIGGVIRPGIVHRIDRDTSGLIVATKNDRAHEHLQAQFAAHSVTRAYIAIAAQLRGPALSDAGTIETRHGRHPRDRRRFTGAQGERHAITHYEVVERFTGGALLVRCRLETGRTHQIRVHMSEHGAPLLADPLYGGRVMERCHLIQRCALHAETLGFSHPSGEVLHFHAEPPEDFALALGKLRRGNPWKK